MRSFSFVIPCWNHYNLLHQILFDIYQKCSRGPIKEVIVMDNGSTDQDFADGIDWWKTNGMLPIRHLRTRENVGFLRASNIGLKKAEGDIICLISDDVRIHKDIVASILSFDPIELLLIGGRLLDWDTGWNTFDGRVFPYLEGWLLAAHRDVWSTIDYFDELYAPNDMEDVDISTKAIECGYSLATLPENYTTHIGAQSIGYSPEREALTKINKEKFRNKWIK